MPAVILAVPVAQAYQAAEAAPAYAKAVFRLFQKLCLTCVSVHACCTYTRRHACIRTYMRTYMHTVHA